MAMRAAGKTNGFQCAALIALVTAVTASVAQTPNSSLELTQYSHTTWTIRDGYLKAGVRAIAQTPDGYLWLGTEFGLVRFDGVRFAPWTPPSGQRLPSSNVRSLTAGRDGTLWIGTLEGLASWKNGTLRQYPETAKQNVLALLEDREGTVWAGTFGVPKAKLCAIRGAGVQCYGEDGALGQWVWSIYEDHDHHLWVGAETGLWRWTPGPPKRYVMARPIATSQSIVQLAPQTGPLAVGEGISQLVGEKLKEYPLKIPRGRLTTPINLFVDHGGALWIGTLQRGLLRESHGKTSVFDETDGLSSNHVMTIFQDREDNLWVGTGDGLDRFRVPAVYQISTKQGLSSPSVWAVLAARDNTVWLTTLDGLNRLQAGHVTVYRSGTKESIRMRAVQSASPGSPEKPDRSTVTEVTDPELPDDRVGSIYEDDRGRIWVSTPGAIARFDGGRFTKLKELPGGWVNAIVSDTHSGIWISYQDQGVVHWTDGKVVERIPWSTLGGNVIASSAIADPVRGGLWLGFFEGGLVFFKDGQVRAHYGSSDGFGRGRVMDLELDPDGSLWAATEGGLSRLKDNRVATLTTANGLPCDTVHWAKQLDDSFWVYSACGVLQVPQIEMKKWSADPRTTIAFKMFDSSDGVRSRALLSGYTPRVSTGDGKLWFTHLESVSVLDPHNLHVNSVAPGVQIEQITADGQSYSATSALQLPPRIRDLAIDYTALSLSAPEKVQFRVKLEGQDSDWRVPANPRHAHYTNLSPGKYTFRVRASNNSGVWNEAGASLEFSIAPAYYQTDWFRLLCAAFLIMLILAGFQVRERQLRRQFKLALEARVDERTRIARELHDTLLQSFHGLLLRFHTVSELLPERAAEAKQTLDSAINQAADAITEGRDAVQGLRTLTVQNNDLALAISMIGEELASLSNDSRPKVRVAVEGEPRQLHPILRDDILKIASEALRNVFQHAQARQVEVEIRYDDDQFRLRVRDDGRGIDSAVSRDGIEGHYGLRGMRERATLIGGNLTIWSEVEAGSEIELRIPARSAYAAARKRSWFATFAGKG